MVAILASDTRSIDVRMNTFQGCAEEYGSIMAPMFQVSPIASENEHAANAAIAWQTDLCVFGYGESNPFARTQTQQERQNGGHLISVARFLSGTEQGYSDDCVIDRVPGPIYVLDHARALQTINSRFRVQTVFVPKSILALPDDAFDKERVIELTNPSGQLLHTCMTDLYASLTDGAPTLPPTLLHRFFALLKVNLGVHAQREDVRAHFRTALREQISKFIEHNLGNPDLSVSTVLANFGLSRASLFRMFEKQGGVRNYIMRRRAIRAAIDISNTAHVRGSIKQASLRWGFTSRPNFNRSIRNMFGSSPGGLYLKAPIGREQAPVQNRVLKRFADSTAQAA